MATYALYGPPGCGKSTAILTARDLGVGALDLETVPEADRLRTFSDPDVVPVFFGMNGLSIKKARGVRDGFDHVFHVLILPMRRDYDRQRAARDLAHPEKAGQKDYYDGFARSHQGYDIVVSSGNDFVKMIVEARSST